MSMDEVGDALEGDEETHGKQEQPVEQAPEQLRALPAVRQRPCREAAR